MKKLIVVLNDLEQSGKTSVSRALSYYFQEKEVTHSIITTDESDVDDYFRGDYWDFEDELETSSLIHTMDRNDVVILDLHSGAARAWNEFCEENEIEAVLGEMDVEMTLLVPEHGSERCHEEVADLAEIFSDSADYIVAHLPIPARRSEPSKWRGSYAQKSMVYLGAHLMDIPEVTSELKTALASHDFTLPSAINKLEDLPRFVEVELMQWLEATSEAFDQCADYLIPETSDGLVLA